MYSSAREISESPTASGERLVALSMEFLFPPLSRIRYPAPSPPAAPPSGSDLRGREVAAMLACGHDVEVGVWLRGQSGRVVVSLRWACGCVAEVGAWLFFSGGRVVAWPKSVRYLFF